ncbi:helix-turn-helix transcriptional regulator [Micromonospora sp. CPCC 205558]|uniref:helix-turn-helix transcriptional regulator n=1 Tax=Micromonospora sp. CPCC 205558 TaxID=3122403 RepID=UPI002FF22048
MKAEDHRQGNRPEGTITVEAAHLYQWILQRGQVSSGELEDATAVLGQTPDELAEALASLLTLRLLRHAPEEPDVLVANSPDAAVAELVGPLEFEVRQRQRRMEALEATLLAFNPIYFNTRQVRNRREAIDIIDEVDRVRATLAGIARRCSVEVFSAHPGVLSDGAIEESLPKDLEMLARGIRIRTVHQHPVRVHPRMRPFLKELVDAGCDVRTREEITDRIIIFDREIAVIPNMLASGAVVLREPSVVDYLYRSLEQVWASALPFDDETTPNGGYGVAGDDLKRALLHLLAAGRKDEFIARKLSISVRTCRRHIAEIMHDLGAESRFQAGVLARQRGLLDDLTEAG